MRWKLILLVPLIATVLGAGLAFGLVWGFNDHSGRFFHPTPFTWATLVWTLLVIVYASIFVYRHTARRRRLQAALTAACSTLFSILLLFYASFG